MMPINTRRPFLLVMFLAMMLLCERTGHHVASLFGNTWSTMTIPGARSGPRAVILVVVVVFRGEGSCSAECGSREFGVMIAVASG
jgi:hypothetical protein